MVPRIRADVRHVHRLALEEHPARDSGVIRQLVALEVVELTIRGDAARELPNPTAVHRDEEDRLGVEHLERAAQDRLEDGLLRPPAIDQAGNFLEGGKEQLVACKVIRCRLHDFPGLGLHGAELNAISVPRFARYSSWRKRKS